MAPKVGHIIIADDDPTLRKMLSRYLEEHDHPVIAASSRSELNRHMQAGPVLIVLDLQLGQDDGLDILRDIRSTSDVPVIIITGQKLDETDPVVGLELGADDYILKPFNPMELLARIRAVLRRCQVGRGTHASQPKHGGYRFDGWKLELRGRRLLHPAGTLVPVSNGEFALLLAFLKSPQRPLSREHLLRAMRLHEDVFQRSVDLRVLRLRRKLEIDPNGPRIIQTARGVGYIFMPSVEPF
jgi:two-component system, OmpR family, response regulator